MFEVILELILVDLKSRHGLLVEIGLGCLECGEPSLVDLPLSVAHLVPHLGMMVPLLLHLALELDLVLLSELLPLVLLFFLSIPQDRDGLIKVLSKVFVVFLCSYFVQEFVLHLQLENTICFI